MHTVEWSDALLLDYQPMDEVHHEFVGLLARAQQAPDNTLAQAWSTVIEHTVHHFGQEDEWMRRTHHTGTDNHIMQHKVVLNIMREGLAQARAGDFRSVREMAGELAVWFAKHTQSQDAALALHMRSHAGHAGGRRAAAKVASQGHAPH